MKKKIKSRSRQTGQKMREKNVCLQIHFLDKLNRLFSFRRRGVKGLMFLWSRFQSGAKMCQNFLCLIWVKSEVQAAAVKTTSELVRKHQHQNVSADVKCLRRVGPALSLCGPPPSFSTLSTVAFTVGVTGVCSPALSIDSTCL